MMANSTMANSVVEDLYNNSPHKIWIKRIPDDNNLHIDNYPYRRHFDEVADIVLDNEVKQNGEKKRQSVIKWEPSVDKDTWNNKNEWIYIFTINGNIVKFGGTRDGLKGRIGSYLSGHHTVSRGGKDKMSVTNAYIYNTFEFYINLGYEIKMYGLKLPETTVTHNILGDDVNIFVQTYHAYEAKYLSDFIQNYYTPFLCNNKDPTYA